MFSAENVVIARYQTDDRDYPESDQRDLIIFPHQDGWMVETVPIGSMPINPVFVRPSGKIPALAICLQEAYYRILGNRDPKSPYQRTCFWDLLNELDAWCSKYNQVNKIKLGNLVDVPDEDFAVFSTDETGYTLKTAPELHICFGGNGDWYVQSMNQANRSVFGVRLALSGGASWAIPNLCRNISSMYRFIHSEVAQSHEFITYEALHIEVESWRKRYPDQCFTGFSIVDQFKDDI